MVLVASNDGRPSHPGWYFNLTADPVARVEVMARTITVRAEVLAADEAAEWWQRIVRTHPTYDRYARATTRTFPIVRPCPVPPTEPEGSDQ